MRWKKVSDYCIVSDVDYRIIKLWVRRDGLTWVFESWRPETHREPGPFGEDRDGEAARQRCERDHRGQPEP
jgi:hypothetical protein